MTDSCFRPEILQLLDRGKTQLSEAVNMAELLRSGTTIARAIELYKAWYLDCGEQDAELERRLFSAFNAYLQLEAEVRKVAREAMAVGEDTSAEEQRIVK